MAISDWMPTLKRKLEEIKGLEQVFTYLDMPGTLQAFPCALISLETGGTTYGASGVNLNSHTLSILVVATAQILPQAQGQIVPLIESIHNKLAENMSLNGTVTTILPPDGTFTDAAGWYEKIVLPYGDKNLPGYEFRYIVKEKNQNDITPAA